MGDNNIIDQTFQSPCSDPCRWIRLIQMHWPRFKHTKESRRSNKRKNRLHIDFELFETFLSVPNSSTVWIQLNKPFQSTNQSYIHTIPYTTTKITSFFQNKKRKGDLMVLLSLPSVLLLKTYLSIWKSQFLVPRWTSAANIIWMSASFWDNPLFVAILSIQDSNPKFVSLLFFFAA